MGFVFCVRVYKCVIGYRISECVHGVSKAAISVPKLRSSTSNAQGQSPVSKHPFHSATFYYHWVIPIKLTAKSVK